MSENEKFTVGELKVLLKNVPDTAFVRLIVIDDSSKSITMSGYLDYVIKPKRKDDTLQLYAGGEAVI